MYARIRGAWCCSAKAARVREEPYMEELPTERTASMIMALIMDGRTGMEALVMARTKGEAFASALVVPFSCGEIGS